jgi:hypothetical protein
MTVGAVIAAAAALFAVVLPPLGSAPAAATHPCASGPSGTYDPNPSADHDACTGSIRPAPADGTEVVLTLADNGRTITLARGQRLRVELQAGGDLWPDVVAGPALHRRGIYLLQDRTKALFTALSPTPGQQVSATSDSPCLHAQPACSVPQRQWSVSVVVEDRQDTGPTPSPQQCMRRPVPSIGPQTVLVEEGHNGRTVQVPLGWKVYVAFSGCKDSGVDYQPAMGGGPLFRESVSADNPGGATSTFRAMSRGTTTITTNLDAPCLHEPNGCSVVATVWQVTVEVVEPRYCELTGPQVVLPGTTVQLTGRVDAGATVRIWFQAGGSGDYAVRRTLTAGPDGSVATTYTAVADQRWYATADGGCTTPTGQTRVFPTVTGPPTAAAGATVRVVVRGPAGQSVRLYMREPGGEFVLRRIGQLDANGYFRTSYVARTDERYFARTGPDNRDSPRALTQVR